MQPVGDVDFSVRSVKGPVLQQQDWDDVFTVLSRGPEALRLEFSTLDVPKFKKWLTSWGNGILTSGALFPPLPMPFRVDYPKDPAVGLDLEFLSVTVNGEVSETGKLELRVVEVNPQTSDHAKQGTLNHHEMSSWSRWSSRCLPMKHLHTRLLSPSSPCSPSLAKLFDCWSEARVSRDS